MSVDLLDCRIKSRLLDLSASMMELFVNIVNCFRKHLLKFFAKRSVVDVWLGLKYNSSALPKIKAKY